MSHRDRRSKTAIARYRKSWPASAPALRRGALSLDLTLVGHPFRGQFESRVKGLVEDIKDAETHPVLRRGAN
jgi:ATP-dependent Clp protease ATP-binding subunit ClpA